MPTEHKVDRVCVVEVVQHVRRVGQQDRKTTWHLRWDAAKIRPVQGRIVHPNDTQFTRFRRDKHGLIDQQRDFMAISHFAVPVYRNAAVMIVVAQCHIDRR